MEYLYSHKTSLPKYFLIEKIIIKVTFEQKNLIFTTDQVAKLL